MLGPHKNGADIDPDEELFAQLAVNAGAAYDHIHAERIDADMGNMPLNNNALRLQAVPTPVPMGHPGFSSMRSLMRRWTCHQTLRGKDRSEISRSAGARTEPSKPL